METVRQAITNCARSYEDRLHRHVNVDAIQLLDNDEEEALRVSIVKCEKQSKARKSTRNLSVVKSIESRVLLMNMTLFGFVVVIKLDKNC